MVFAGFIEQLTAVSSGARIYSYFRLSSNAEGKPELPALVLLHGFTQNSLIWESFVEEIPKNYSVFVPDLPGYGKSIKAVSSSGDSLAHSKQEWAEDILEALDAVVGLVVGFTTDPVKIIPYGHDRGALLAYRLALSFPDRVSGVGVLDIVPTLFVWDGMKLENDMHGETRSSWHWICLSSPCPIPETWIASNVKLFISTLFQCWMGTDTGEKDEWVSDAIKQYADPVHGTPERIIGCCENHRAGATHDVKHDLQAVINPENPSRVFNIPFLVLSSMHLRRRFAVDEIWERIGSEGLVTSHQIGDGGAGHFLAQSEVVKRTREWLWANWHV